MASKRSWGWRARQAIFLVRRALGQRFLILAFVVFLCLFVVSISRTLLTLSSELTRSMSSTALMETPHKEAAPQEVVEAPKASCLRIWEPGSENAEQQVFVDRYLESRCDTIHISRALRVVQALEPLPVITKEQVEAGWMNLCWGWSNEEEFAGYKFDVNNCHMGLRIQILDNLLYFTPAPLNHTNFKDLEYLYAGYGTILDDGLWFQVGRIVHGDPAYYDTSWTRHALHALTSLQEMLADHDVPDADFLLSFSDRCAPVAYQTLAQNLAPMMSWSLRDDNYGASCNALFLPTYDYTWSQQDFKEGSPWRVDSYPPVPWELKDARAVWRGTLTAVEPRARVLRMGLARPDLIDSRHTGPVDDCKRLYIPALEKHGGPIGEDDCERMTTESALSAEGLLHYKYLLDVEGHGPSFRLKNLLLANSVVFKLWEEGLQWFYPDLKAYKHYIPISAFNFELDLEKKIEWARHNDDVVKRIGERGAAFAKQYIDNPNLARYQALTISLYASRLSYKPTKHPLAKLMCCRNLTMNSWNGELEHCRKRCRERPSVTSLCNQ